MNNKRINGEEMMITRRKKGLRKKEHLYVVIIKKRIEFLALIVVY